MKENDKISTAVLVTAWKPAEIIRVVRRQRRSPGGKITK